MSLRHGKWLRHAVILPAVVAGAWHGVEAGSRGAILVAGAGAVAWLVWPEAARLVAFRRGRRAERARRRAARAIERAALELTKAEHAKRRAKRRPASERLARRAERLEKRAGRSVARAERAKERDAHLSASHSAGPTPEEH